MRIVKDHNTLNVLKSREFSIFIVTRFIVIFALFLQNTVLSYKLYTITKDPFSLGLLGLFELIPAFGCAFFAGYYVDKNEKRNMYAICVGAYLINTLFITTICTRFFHIQFGNQAITWCMYAAMFISGIIRAFLAPSSFSLMPMLVPKKDITYAVTWSSTSWLLGSVLGPLAGGIFMAKIGIVNALLISIILFVLASILILQISKKEINFTKDIGMLKGLMLGFRFVFKNQLILAVLSLDLFAVLFGGAEALLPVVSKEILHVGEIGFGWLRSAHGIGSICLLVLLSFLPLQTNTGKKLLISVALFGVCIILFGLSTHFLFSFFVLFLAGIFDGVSVVIRHSILQTQTPEELKGRVSSINMMFISSSNELGAFESGLTARLMGTSPAIIFGGIMTVLVVIITTIKAPLLRKLHSMSQKK